MQDVLSQLASHRDAVPLLCSTLSFVTGLAVWITLQWRLHRRTQMEVGLKRDMIERGMSAEEIERVMRASLRSGDSQHSA